MISIGTKECRVMLVGEQVLYHIREFGVVKISRLLLCIAHSHSNADSGYNPVCRTSVLCEYCDEDGYSVAMVIFMSIPVGYYSSSAIKFPVPAYGFRSDCSISCSVCTQHLARPDLNCFPSSLHLGASIINQSGF